MANHGDERRRPFGTPGGQREARLARPAPPQQIDPCDGVLLVDKPAGPTSHDIVDAIRGVFGFRKVGHGGTLDPMATGLLLILIGRGTKLSGTFLGSDKTYEGTMRLGATTDSQDAQGVITSQREWNHITREQVEAAMIAHKGDQFQTPPMVSAVKVDGAPLYKSARKGKTVERKARLIRVYSFPLLDFTPPSVRFRVRCTKGTYVRTLCADIGDELGCGAHLTQLERTQSGDLSIDAASPLENILKLSKDELLKKIIPIRQFMR